MTGKYSNNVPALPVGRDCGVASRFTPTLSADKRSMPCLGFEPVARGLRSHSSSVGLYDH